MFHKGRGMIGASDQKKKKKKKIESVIPWNVK